jgi:Uma2 family endonuclease
MSTQTEETTQAAEVQSKKGTPTWEIAYLYPQQGQWTEAEYLALDTNRLIELSNGCLEFLPMPTPYHQVLMLFVFDQLRQFIAEHNLGRVLPAPLPIRLWPGQIREPDIAFFKPERLSDLKRQPNGADLVVEVVSPGEEARERDLETKRQEYARAGISEYWIVDPEKEVVTVLTLEGETFRVHGDFKKGQTADSVLLEGFELDVSALFAAGEAGEKKS